MVTNLYWVKSLRADISGNFGKGWNLRGRELEVKKDIQKS